MKRQSYKTKQKDKILECIKTFNKQFTIKELYLKLNKSIGLTTIYRLITKLVNDKVLTKYITSDNKTYYEYLMKCNHENHFYLKCDKCSKLIHIDCDCIKELENHILNSHKFKVNHENIVIKGICNNCKGEILDERINN